MGRPEQSSEGWAEELTLGFQLGINYHVHYFITHGPAPERRLPGMRLTSFGQRGRKLHKTKE